MPSIYIPTTFGLCRLSWEGDLITSFKLPDAEPVAADLRAADSVPPPALAPLLARIQLHFQGALQDFSGAPLDWPRVSAFQRSVYLQTQAIKAGSTQSYGAIAEALGLGPEGSRAVGVALATNPWPLLVPCHRVVAANGKMTGFSAPGGIRTKTRLLALEGAALLSE